MLTRMTQLSSDKQNVHKAYVVRTADANMAPEHLLCETASRLRNWGSVLNIAKGVLACTIPNDAGSRAEMAQFGRRLPGRP
jgi:hypothetical protein